MKQVFRNSAVTNALNHRRVVAGVREYMTLFTHSALCFISIADRCMQGLSSLSSGILWTLAVTPNWTRKNAYSPYLSSDRCNFFALIAWGYFGKQNIIDNNLVTVIAEF